MQAEKEWGEGGGGREICWFKYVLFLYYSNEQPASFSKKNKNECRDKFSVLHKVDFNSLTEFPSEIVP